ncbi:MAG: ROK family protein [Candidatus Niyogibacteria bacterium]|nr:ROK family protein [Candidatus Niyogibacteria bacterium]
MYLLFDIGATKTRIAVSDGDRMGEPVIIPTHQNFDEALRVFVSAAQKVLNGARPEKIVGGATGKIARHAPLKKTLEDALSAPVMLENDAALAGLGEAHFGAGRGREIVAYFTISTGVGGARIVRGAIDANAQGFEPGFHIIETATRQTLEDAISGRAVERRFGVKPEAIRDAQLWEELAEKLAVGIHNAVVFWSPDIVILGGSMILGNPAIPLERIHAHLAALPQIFPELPTIEKAALGDSAGLYGALALANR